MFVDVRNERTFIFGSALRFLAPDCLETGKPFTFRKVFKEVITVKSWQDVDENFEQLWCNLEKMESWMKSF